MAVLDNFSPKKRFCVITVQRKTSLSYIFFTRDKIVSWLDKTENSLQI